LLGEERAQEVVDIALALEEEDGYLDSEELRRLAQAYGMLGDEEQYLATWKKIVESEEEEISLDYADWFYLPEAVSKSPDFWDLIQSILPVVEEIDTTVDIEDEDNMSVEELFEAIKEHYLAQAE
jgi:hypothetical protein